jgi:hypothetical protein
LWSIAEFGFLDRERIIHGWSGCQDGQPNWYRLFDTDSGTDLNTNVFAYLTSIFLANATANFTSDSSTIVHTFL